MQEKENRTTEELLAAYPDISVSRDRIGYMLVFIDGGAKPEKKLFLSLGRDASDEVKCHLTIAIAPETKEGGYSYIKIFPVSSENAQVETEGLSGKIDSQEIIRKAKQGLELFEGAKAIGFAGIPNNRVYDWMQAEDENLMQRSVQLEVSKAEERGWPLSEVLKYAHPKDYYLHMLELLDLKVA